MSDRPTPCITKEVQFAIRGDNFSDIPSSWGHFPVKGDDCSVRIIELERPMTGRGMRTKAGAIENERKIKENHQELGFRGLCGKRHVGKSSLRYVTRVEVKCVQVSLLALSWRVPMCTRSHPDRSTY